MLCKAEDCRRAAAFAQKRSNGSRFVQDDSVPAVPQSAHTMEKEGKPMQNAEAIHVQPNSRTTMGSSAICRFPRCIMAAMASSGQGSERLNAQLLVDSIPALIHTGRPDGYLDYFNRPWLEYLGVTLDKVAGWNWTAYVHPEDVEGIVAKWRACLATGEVFEYETRVRR